MLHHHDGKVSLHKPLALLWAIGRVARGGVRLVLWAEFREQVGALLAEFGPGYASATPQYPFWHLGSSAALWEVHGLSDVPTAADVTAAAGLTRQATVLLRDKAILAEVVDLLLDHYLSSVPDQQQLMQRVGLANERARVLPDAHQLLRSLKGAEIVTGTGKLNTVLAVHRDRAVVATERSPAGRVVEISDVQKGLDLLARHGSVRVHPDVLGHRSSFVGALLATLPGAKFAQNPLAVTLRPQTPERIATDHTFGVLDRVAEVKIRTEQAQLRRMLAGNRASAKCALCGDEYPMEFLVAAHIKKRSECTDDERRDLPHVAMLACTFGCDALYETGWVTVDHHGRIRATSPSEAPEGTFKHRLTQLEGRSCAAHPGIRTLLRLAPEQGKPQGGCARDRNCWTKTTDQTVIHTPHRRSGTDRLILSQSLRTRPPGG